MSLLAKTTFALCCAISVGTIVYVHYRQEFDRNKLHAGVVRDVEQQQRRKIENLYVLQQQSELSSRLKKEQMLQKESS